MKKHYKIVVVGLGYVGLSNAVLLAQENEVVGVDISQERVDKLNARKSPIVDAELSQYLVEKNLNLRATTDLASSVKGADYVIVSTPTNFDEKTNFFDTSTVEEVISQVIESEPAACVVVKSTIPVGFIDEFRNRMDTNAVIFSPEFLREGRALYDNLFPSRIIIGEKSQRANIFAKLLTNGSLKPKVEVLLTGTREAEAIKLFSNTYLALRVAFFNELDSFALSNEISALDLISGVSLDSRIGKHYNNPSFGYGGYCLPKDTKQLLATYCDIPQNLIKSVVEANDTRKLIISDHIQKLNPNVVGIYRLVMKEDSDNLRESAVIDIIKNLKDSGVEVVIYEPILDGKSFLNCPIIKVFESFTQISDIIVANRRNQQLKPHYNKVFTRDIFQEN